MKFLNLNKKIRIAFLIGLLVISSITPNSYAQSNLQQDDSQIVPMATGAFSLKNLEYGDTHPYQLGWLNKGDIVSVTSSSWYPDSIRLVLGLRKRDGNGVGHLSNSGDTRSYTVPEDGFYEFYVSNFSSTKATVLNGNISIKY